MRPTWIGLAKVGAPCAALRLPTNLPTSLVAVMAASWWRWRQVEKGHTRQEVNAVVSVSQTSRPPAPLVNAS